MMRDGPKAPRRRYEIDTIIVGMRVTGEKEVEPRVE
jgi:hypothetical protein